MDRNVSALQGVLLACVQPMLIAAVSVPLPVLPDIIKAFPEQPHIAELVPLVAVMPILMVALTSVAFGVLGGKIGRRRLLILGTGLFALSALIPFFINSFVLLLVSRAIMGLALGAMVTSALVLIGDYYSGATLQKWLGIQVGLSSVTSVVVSVASGMLGVIGWRYAFLPLSIGALLFVALVVVKAPPVKDNTDDAPAPVHKDGEPTPWGLLLPVFAFAAVATIIVFPPNFEFSILLDEKALGASQMTGFALALLWAAAAVAGFGVGVLRRMRGPAQGALALAVACVGTVLIAQSTTLTPLLIGAVLVGAGAGLVQALSQIWLLESTPDRLRGQAAGLFQAVIALSLFVTPLIARWVAVSVQSSSAAMRIYAVAEVVGIVILMIPLFTSLFHRRGSAR